MGRCWYGGRRKQLHPEILWRATMIEEWIALSARSGQNVARGSPAHAGMDPGRGTAPRSISRLPRPRGDGPELQHQETQYSQAPPPTRGWTVQRHGLCHGGGGSPAHAGMDPIDVTAADVADGLPRPRGDGPRAREDGPRASSAPPPTWGWTHGTQVFDVGVRGSPAHAGMDPST